MKSIKSIDKTAKSIGAFDSINYGVYQFPIRSWFLAIYLHAIGHSNCKATPTRKISKYWQSISEKNTIRQNMSNRFLWSWNGDITYNCG